MTLIPYTIEEQISEAERELAMRREVYPRLIDRKQLSYGVAERRIELMEAIVRTLTTLRTG